MGLDVKPLARLILAARGRCEEGRAGELRRLLDELDQTICVLSFKRQEKKLKSFVFSGKACQKSSGRFSLRSARIEM
jgi:hypothetical protein